VRLQQPFEPHKRAGDRLRFELGGGYRCEVRRKTSVVRLSYSDSGRTASTRDSNYKLDGDMKKGGVSPAFSRINS